jgi:hypothetical protein
MNLLENIKKDCNHPFNDFLNISDDFSSIYSNGKQKVIYGEKKCLENLSREIILHTMMNDVKGNYSEEQQAGDKNRTDLISIPYGNDNVMHIIEFKNQKSIKQHYVNGIFNEVNTKYIENTNYANKEFFVSVVITNIEEIIHDPICITRYMETSPEEQRFKGISIFKEHNIYIETKKHIPNTGIDGGYVKNHLPTFCRYQITNSYHDIDGIPRKICKIKDAIQLPSKTHTYGVKNIRNIKDFTFPGKVRTTLDILNTCMIAFSTKNKDLLANSGKEKDLLYIIEDTIRNEITFDGMRYITVSSLNFATVDGQNSLHSIKTVIAVLQEMCNFVPISGNHFYERVKTIIKSKISAHNEQLDFLNFLLNECYVNIRVAAVDNVKNATMIAISKNNSMEVTHNELAAASKIDNIQQLAETMLKMSNYVIDYPQRSKVAIPLPILETRCIGYERLSLLNHVAETIKNWKDIDYFRLMKFSSDLSKERASKNINSLCKKFTQETAINGNASLESEYESLKETQMQIAKLEGKIEVRKEDLDNGKITQDEYDEEINSLESELQILKDEEEIINCKIDSNKIVKITTINEEQLKKMLETYFIMGDVIRESKKQDSMWVTKQNKMFTEKGLENILISMAMVYNKMHNQFDENIATFILDEWKRSQQWYMNTFPNGDITTVRNKENNSMEDCHGNMINTSDIRENLFKFLNV